VLFANVNIISSYHFCYHFGGELEPKRLHLTWTPQSRLSQLNGSDSQVYTEDSSAMSVCTLLFQPTSNAVHAKIWKGFWLIHNLYSAQLLNPTNLLRDTF